MGLFFFVIVSLLLLFADARFEFLDILEFDAQSVEAIPRVLFVNSESNPLQLLTTK